MAKIPKTKDDQTTVELLLKAATKVFAEKGYGGATVKEIADEAGVNISLISYHFQGKEGLFRTCLESFGSAHLAKSEQILTAPESVEDLKAKLKLWSRQFLLCHVEESELCSILNRENLFEMDVVKDVFQDTFLKSFEAMVNFFKNAKKVGIVRKEMDPLTIAGFYFGAIVHTGHSDDIAKEYFGRSIEDEKYREQLIDQFVTMLLRGVT
jgi:AcrR family transcriptional regulator